MKQYKLDIVVEAANDSEAHNLLLSVIRANGYSWTEVKDSPK